MDGLQKINWSQIDTQNVPNEIKLELGSLIMPIDKIYAKNIVGFDGTTSGFTSVNGPVFITDITPVNINDNVTNKVRNSDGVVLDSCLTSTQNVIVHVLAMTGISNYIPKVTVNDIHVDLVGSTDKPLFTGQLQLTLNNIGSLIAKHEDGSSYKTVIFYDSPPQILSAQFSGNYPTGQIELKSGDTFNVTVTSDVPFNMIKLDNYGAFNEQTFSFVQTTNKTITGVITRRSDFTEFFGAKLKIRKPNDTFSETFTINGIDNGINGVYLNDLLPTIEISDIIYPNGQEALKDEETAEVVHNIENFDNVIYTCNEISTTEENTYDPNIIVYRTGGTYNITTPNFTITAYRIDNGGTTSKSYVVNIADELPTITISGATNRLISGGNDGTDPQYYTITINSNQNILEKPTMTSSGGKFKYDEWTYVNKKQYSNRLMIHDVMPRGNHYFNDITVKNLAGKIVTKDSEEYIIGGFVSRTVDVITDMGDNEGFGDRAIINVSVSDYDKLPSTLNWSFKQLPIKKLIGITEIFVNSWSIDQIKSNDNKTTIYILDDESTRTSSSKSTITINENY